MSSVCTELFPHVRTRSYETMQAVATADERLILAARAADGEYYAHTRDRSGRWTVRSLGFRERYLVKPSCCDVMADDTGGLHALVPLPHGWFAYIYDDGFGARRHTIGDVSEHLCEYGAVLWLGWAHDAQAIVAYVSGTGYDGRPVFGRWTNLIDRPTYEPLRPRGAGRVLATSRVLGGICGYAQMGEQLVRFALGEESKETPLAQGSCGSVEAIFGERFQPAVLCAMDGCADPHRYGKLRVIDAERQSDVVDAPGPRLRIARGSFSYSGRRGTGFQLFSYDHATRALLHHEQDRESGLWQPATSLWSTTLESFTVCTERGGIAHVFARTHIGFVMHMWQDDLGTWQREVLHQVFQPRRASA